MIGKKMPLDLQGDRNQLSIAMTALVGGETFTDENFAEFQTMTGQIEELDRHIDARNTALQNEAANATVIMNHAEQQGVTTDQMQNGVGEHERVFNNWLSNGVEFMNGDDRQILNNLFVTNTQTVGTDAKGGFTVTPIFHDMLITKVTELCPIHQIATVYNTPTGADEYYTTDDDSMNMGEIVGEGQQVGAALDIEYDRLMMQSVIYSSRPIRISNSLLNDSTVNMIEHITGKLAARIAKKQGVVYTSGDGAGSTPKGIVPSASAGITTPNGITDAISFSMLSQLEHSLVSGLRMGASYMFSDGTLENLKLLLGADGRPLWKQSHPDGTPSKISLYSYFINDEMDEVAADKVPVVFGNFKNYKIRVVDGSSLVRFVEKYAETYETGFLSFVRGFGGLEDFGGQSIKQLKMAVA